MKLFANKSIILKNVIKKILNFHNIICQFYNLSYQYMNFIFFKIYIFKLYVN